MPTMTLPATIRTEKALDSAMTEPGHALIEDIVSLQSPLVVLGGSGKMGPSLALLAKRAALQANHDLHVVAVSRFSDEAAREWLGNFDIETIACDLLDRESTMALPDSQNVVFMAGRKFGTVDNPALTWAMNTVAPTHAAERYARSRVVALSTGCVYPLVPVASGGSREEDELIPRGEYANACVARERIFEYYSRRDAIPMVQIRLNYALDLRYGVFVDIATRVLQEVPIDLTMGYVNCIWQRDANEIILRSFRVASVPPTLLNVTSREVLRVRDVALRFGELLGREPRFQGTESDYALLSDPSRAYELFGPPATGVDAVMQWTAEWLAHEGRTLAKPTHYEGSDGRY